MNRKKATGLEPDQMARLLAEGAPEQPEPSPLATGQRVDDFEIIEEVGRGGMGVVYRAYEHSLKRVVALKVINRDISTDASAVKRFRREATLAANLDHPNLIHVHHLSPHENPLYFTMEFIQGRSLRDKVEQRGFLAPAEAVRIALQVCDALQYAHDRTVIHRDIKPSNILLQNHLERVRISDFGIAQDLSGQLAELTRTKGISPGTLAFMSPEQNRGEKLGPRTDIYSLGMTLYYMLTGRVVYSVRNPAELADAFRDVVPKPPSHHNPGVSQAVDRIVLKMIRVNPEERYGSCAEVGRDLARLALAEDTPHPRSATAAAQPRLRWFLLLAGAAVLVSVFVLVTMWLRSTPTTLPVETGGAPHVTTAPGGSRGSPIMEMFVEDFNDNPNWTFNGDFEAPNFKQYPGIRRWVNGPMIGERLQGRLYYVGIADGIVSGWGHGYGKETDALIPTIHRQLDFDASRGFSLTFRAISAVDWPNAANIFLFSDWKEGSKKVKYYGFRIYGESSNHTIDLLSTSLDSLSNCLYRYKAGALVNEWHTYTFSRSADGVFQLLIDGKRVQAFQPPPDKEYSRFNRIAIEVMRAGSKIDWVRLAPVPLKTAKGKIFAGEEDGGTPENPDAGWDGDFSTYTEAKSNGNALKAITWETTESHWIPPKATNIRLHAKVERHHWQSGGWVYVYNYITDTYDQKMGGEGEPDGVKDETVPLTQDYVRNGEVKVRALLSAKHSPQAYARYYESEILYEDQTAR